jgi:hypothetical protein
MSFNDFDEKYLTEPVRLNKKQKQFYNKFMEGYKEGLAGK